MSNQDLDPRVKGEEQVAEGMATTTPSEMLNQSNSSSATDSIVSQAKLAQTIDPNGDYFKPWLESYSLGVPEFVDTRPCENLVEVLESAVAKYSNQAAFVNFGSSFTYREISEKSSKFAAFLQCQMGLKQGDKLAIMLPNVLQFPIAFFGAMKAGVTVTNVNPLYTPRELQAQLDNSDAVAIVVMYNFAYNLAKIIKQTKIKQVILTEIGDCLNGWLGTKRFLVNAIVRHKLGAPKFTEADFPQVFHWIDVLRHGQLCLTQFKKPEIHYDDIALLQYTGGTTGRSKGAMLSHGNIISNIAQALGMYGPVLKQGKETILTVIPLYHIFALTVNMVFFTYIGGKNILITDPRDLKRFAKDLHNHQEISCITGVNTLFNLFITHEEFTDLKWENLHLVIGGGAAVQSGVEDRFYRKTGFHILEGYGLTECSPLCAVCPFDVDGYKGYIGLMVPSTIARIVDADGNEVRDMENAGELEIKGPQVMHGYYKNPDNQDIFDDGYVRTGDIAKWMPGGYVKLIDRLKDMILVSGFNVFPNEIEDVISRFNRVLECAVVGIPSDITGEAVKVYAVKRDQSLTAGELKQYCRAYLTPYKVPRVIHFVDSLPKSTLGKVLRRKLRDLDRKNELNAEDQLLLLRSGFDPNAADAKEQLATLKAKLEKEKQEQQAQQAREAAERDAKDGKKKQGKDACAEAGAGAGEGAANAAADLSSVAPARKSAGALALERLMSSKNTFGAAIETPNIHCKLDEKQLANDEARQREHFAKKIPPAAPVAPAAAVAVPAATSTPATVLASDGNDHGQGNQSHE